MSYLCTRKPIYMQTRAWYKFIIGVLLVACSCRQQDRSRGAAIANNRFAISAVQHRKLKLKKDVFGETNPDITLEQILTS